jgi:hypothetical protein
MSQFPTDAIAAYRDSIGTAVSEAVRDLLQNKHLYQSTSVDFDGATRKVRSFLPVHEHRVFDSVRGDPTKLPFILDESAATERARTFANSSYIFWKAPHIKTYCATCERVEPFNVDSMRSVVEGPANSADGKFTQVFSIAYTCQSCKGIPEAFLIRRVGTKLTLSGRTPMEVVQTPDYVPREIRTFYSGAEIAYQSGQSLPAVFMLRTACEQWVKRFADPTDKVDQAIDKYMAQLPDGFRDTFPSMRDMYGTLSVAVHNAAAEPALYESVRSDFCRHFDARRVHNLPNSKEELAALSKPER